eukprot:CAMPEP_0172617082 /NCGR_PEP_ID=MMETSP1068-20121228/70026_1 /TAXON_ID=35684 /ORGANISM="Pseudopedinella elastica, Strain CCMP716" /LENGTH=391 /DNA_ID=CAMNT_0013422751 /DNA_START=110 /DNA_END=1281 /DNA_ORIENTATION=+
MKAKSVVLSLACLRGSASFAFQTERSRVAFGARTKASKALRSESLKSPSVSSDLTGFQLFEFNQLLRDTAALNPESLDKLVLDKLTSESKDLLRSPILRPWALDVHRAGSLAEAAARVLARKICGAEVGLEMDLDTSGLNRRTDYLIPLFEAALKMNCPCLSLDLLEITTRDPAATSYLQPFLFFKGFHAVALQRIGHQLWRRSEDPVAVEVENLRDPLPEDTCQVLPDSACAERLYGMITASEARHTALWIQCRCSEVFGVDIHPGARIGKSIFMDHATGVVIGETATIGNGVSILHGVTLGGTGKPSKTLIRHPQLGSLVTIGAGASVLGDIAVGDGATVGAQAVVTKSVEPGATVIGLNKVLSKKVEKETKQEGENEGTWWAETGEAG